MRQIQDKSAMDVAEKDCEEKKEKTVSMILRMSAAEANAFRAVCEEEGYGEEEALRTIVEQWVRVHQKCDDEEMGQKIKWIVTAVTPTPDYKLHLTFVTGEKKIYDASDLMTYRHMEPLKDVNFFMTAHVEYGTVVWNDDVDIAPECLYEDSVPEK